MEHCNQRMLNGCLVYHPRFKWKVQLDRYGNWYFIFVFDVNKVEPPTRLKGRFSFIYTLQVQC